jgi:hypothetical protein
MPGALEFVMSPAWCRRTYLSVPQRALIRAAYGTGVICPGAHLVHEQKQGMSDGNYKYLRNMRPFRTYKN